MNGRKVKRAKYRKYLDHSDFGSRDDADRYPFLFYKQPASVVLFLLRQPDVRYGNIHRISLMIDCTWSHISKVAKTLESKGLLRTARKDGRQKNVFLTEKGVKVATLLLETVELLDDANKKRRKEKVLQ